MVVLSQTVPQAERTDCSSRDALTYHSPRCNWGYVVRDPNRTDNITIDHDPPYHTYSRWVLNNETYVFAYRDVDGQPDDMIADIYETRNPGYKLIGDVRIPGIVSNVSFARLTGGELPDVVFRFQGGELQYVDVVRFAAGSAQEVFQYGASTIKIISKPKPMIEAESKKAGLSERFAWNSSTMKFARVDKRKLIASF
jgi:hypothetical protein